MYPSGRWIGYWEQDRMGRHPMEGFELAFLPDGTVAGRGHDRVGRFTFAGTWDAATGRVRMTKQYLGAHRVEYDAAPDGEGSLLGTWAIDHLGFRDRGPFGLSPELPRPAANAPIRDLGG